MLPQIILDAYRSLLGRDRIGIGPTRVAAGNQYNAFTQRSYIRLEDHKAQNTPGGAFASGAWRTRDLNVIADQEEPPGISFLSSFTGNQFRLNPGSYLIRGSAPAYRVGRHQARVQNITDGTTALLGTSASIDNANLVGGRSFFQGHITIAAPKVFEVQHQCETTFANGFGVQANFDTEVYTVVEFIEFMPFP